MDRRRILALLALAALSTWAAAADWPQFRGPGRDGVSAEKGLAASWPADGPKELWRVELGDGYSAPVIAAGRVYTMFSRGDDEFIACFDAADGSELWRVRADATWKDRFANGPRSTPTVDGETVYALGSRGKLLALAAADGALRWSRDLPREFGAKAPKWGVSTSPLVEGKALLVDVGGNEGASIVAFDKASGKELWRAGSDGAGYSAPVAFEAGGVRQVVFFTATSVTALRPSDGTLLWEVPWATSWDVNAATPIFIPPDKLFVSSGYDVGAAVYRIKSGADGEVSVEELWKNREMKNKFSSSVLHDGYIYGFDEKTLKCIGATDGETRWQARGLGHGSLLYADGKLIVLGDEGTLALVEATPEEYREKSRAQVVEGRTWTMPALSGGRLYVRNLKELVAFDVSG